MPYIGEDLVLCCSFILRCTLHLSRVSHSASGQASGQEGEPRVQVDGVYQLYRSNLSKFFLKRDSPVPFGVFSRALVYPWPDAGFLLEPLIEYAFGPTILKNRKLQAVQLLTALFRNSTALSALGQPLLTKRLHSLLQCSQRVITTQKRNFPLGAFVVVVPPLFLFFVSGSIRYRVDRSPKVLVESSSSGGSLSVQSCWEC